MVFMISSVSNINSNEVSNNSIIDKSFWWDLGGRVAVLAPPFLCLHAPSGRVINIGLHALTSVDSLVKLSHTKEFGQIADLSCRASLAAAAVFFALTGRMFSMGVAVLGEMILDMHGLWGAHQKKDKKAVTELGFSLCSSALYAGMLFTGLPEVILSALVLQAILELRHSYSEFHDGRQLEGYAHLALSMVRTFQAIPSAKLTYTKWFVPKKEVKIVTFNILSDTTLKWFGDEVEKRPDDFAWDQRIERIAQTLQSTDADVICLQEVEPKSYEYLCKALGDKYQQSNLALNQNGKFGVAMFVKDSVVDVKSITPYAYQDTTGRVAQIADLRIRGEKYVVGNTHLDQPRRAIQAKELADTMHKTHKTGSFVECGDFNAKHTDDVIRVLEKEGLVHDYKAGPTNNHQNQEAKTIDHVCHSKDLNSKAAPLAAIDRETVLPNPVVGSDHVPLLARLWPNFLEDGLFFDRFWNGYKAKKLRSSV